ncbi:MAG: hypothetical protein ACM37W_13600 [Actinomycetota bacterium]
MPKTIIQRVQKLAALCIAVLLGILLLPIFTRAQSSSQLEFRINLLESQISELRGQIGRLESQGSGRNLPTSPTARTPNSATVRSSGDPMFDNLATLVIELKQDVRSIQERLSQVESRIPRNR